MKLKVVIISILLAANFLVAEGRQKKTKEIPTQPTGQYVLPKPVPFDWFLNATVLPAGYKGDDIIQLYDYLNKIPAKDQFETIEQFTTRMRSTLPRQMFAFIKKYYGNYEVFPRPIYNPENHVLTFAGDGYGNDFYNNGITNINLHFPIVIKREKQTIRKYMGSTEYEDTTQITEYGGKDYNIIPINEIVSFNGKRITISPEDARDLMKNYSLLFVCAVGPNSDFKITSLGYKNQEATFESPTRPSIAYKYTDYNINALIAEIIIFNSRTGVIYDKVRFSKTSE